eukprot:5489732-Amphidinium_carterae.1
MGQTLEHGRAKGMEVDGQEHRHDAWKVCALHLRTLSRKHACKQPAVATQELRFTLTCMHIAVHDLPVHWQTLDLPFGATETVYDFYSVALALELIICDLGVVTSSFFDDYRL